MDGETEKEDDAGDQPGGDYYEAEVSMMEILVTQSIEFNDVRKTVLMGNIDKKHDSYPARTTRWKEIRELIRFWMMTIALKHGMMSSNRSCKPSF